MSCHSTPRPGRRAEISVVIPTRKRPHFVTHAVASALDQDFADIEVLVVIDGDDPATRDALSAISDPRLRIVDLAVNVGGAEARNIGIREARGRWVAFLDDDDEWLPHKLSRQIVTARRSAAAWPVLSSRVLVRTPLSEMLRPLRSYNPRRSISEFLFCRGSFGDSPCAMQTSTLMARREMLLRVPFREGLKRHHDWDWLLRAQRVLGVEFSMIDEPLVVYRAEDDRDSIGRSLDWQFSLEWGHEMRSFMSPKAYSWFLASECASRAAKSRAGLPVYAEIARRFFFHGRPSLKSTAALAAFLALPGDWRESIRQRIKDPVRVPRVLQSHRFRKPVLRERTELEDAVNGTDPVRF